MTLKRHKANASLMPLDDVALHMVRLGLIRMDGAAPVPSAEGLLLDCGKWDSPF